MSSTDEPGVMELFDLTGKNVLVTGASGWLGGAIARGLDEAGAGVVVSSRDASLARKCAAQLPGAGPHHGVRIDHRDSASVADGFDEAVAAVGTLDALVNNGHAHTASDWKDATAEDFTAQLENCTGYFGMARRMREHAVERGAPASIIMLGSMYGLVGSYPDAYDGVCAASPVAYHALKGAVLQMTRHLAVYWAADNVRVNALSPGPFPAAAAPPEMVARLEKKSPMGRMGAPWELKGAVVFLASRASSYVTGQNLVVDGGWTAW